MATRLQKACDIMKNKICSNFGPFGSLEKDKQKCQTLTNLSTCLLQDSTKGLLYSLKSLLQWFLSPGDPQRQSKIFQNCSEISEEA